MLTWLIKPFAELEPKQLYSLLKLRQDVFCLEQNCLYPELDDKDQQSIHILGLDDNRLAAYLRCLPPGLQYQEASIGRVVVDPKYRDQQLGRELMLQGIAYCQVHYPEQGIRISAQLHLKDFYQSLGFEATGDSYDEDGIPHIAMLLHK